MVHKAINIYSLAPYKEPLQPVQHLLHLVALSLVCEPEPLNLCLVLPSPSVPMLGAVLLATALHSGYHCILVV